MIEISEEAYKEAEQEIERLWEEAKLKGRLDDRTFKLVVMARQGDSPVQFKDIWALLKKKELIDLEKIKDPKKLHYLYSAEMRLRKINV